MPTGHYVRTDSMKEKYRLAKLGNKHPLWKGDKIKYNTLHAWINRNLPKPDKCQSCNQIKQLDACNITGIYNRDFKNWRYMCKLCHFHFDGDHRDPSTGRLIPKRFAV